jgi:hypothetical protein
VKRRSKVKKAGFVAKLVLLVAATAGGVAPSAGADPG